MSVKDKLWGKSNGGREWGFKINEGIVGGMTKRLEDEWLSTDEVEYDPPPETMGGPII